MDTAITGKDNPGISFLVGCGPAHLFPENKRRIVLGAYELPRNMKAAERRPGECWRRDCAGGFAGAGDRRRGYGGHGVAVWRDGEGGIARVRVAGGPRIADVNRKALSCNL